MTYTVIWLKSAEDDLTAIWLSARDRNAVSRAAQEIDAVLQRSPDDVGESREEGRILLMAPLGVTFEVHAKDRLVRILEVWHFKTHR